MEGSETGIPWIRQDLGRPLIGRIRQAGPGQWTMIEKVISGGQTGADRGALDAAIELGISDGGWFPYAGKR